LVLDHQPSAPYSQCCCYQASPRMLFLLLSSLLLPLLHAFCLPPCVIGHVIAESQVACPQGYWGIH
jgi:hypothetical protein